MQPFTIEDILPHRGRFKLVDSILSVDEQGALVETRTRSTWPLADGDGVDPLICIELVAQTGGVHIYWQETMAGSISSRALGWLVGVKSARFSDARIPLDTLLTVRAHRQGVQGEYFEVAGSVSVGETPVGDVVLQVVQSDEGPLVP